jgi:hypothetical protein
MKIFKKKKKELTDDVKPRGIKYTIDRPSEADIAKLTKQRENMKKSIITNKVDKMVLQNISDRLYGPESDAYIKALEELNKSFKPRAGKSYLDFYEPGIVEDVKKTQKKINESIKHES